MHANAGYSDAFAALMIGAIQVIILYFLVQTDGVVMNRPGLSRFLFFHFWICTLLGWAFLSLSPVFQLTIWKREQGVELRGSGKIWFMANIFVFVISAVMIFISDSLLSVTVLAICLYVYASTIYYTHGSKTRFHVWYIGIFCFLALILLLWDISFFDDFYASFDNALNVKWYGESPKTFLSNWRATNPSPSSGISLGIGWATGYHTSGTPQDLWFSGFIVAGVSGLFAALFVYLYNLICEEIRNDGTLASYKKLLDPQGDGLENLARFFSAAQEEALGLKSTGISNNEAMKEFLSHPTLGPQFIQNVSKLKSKEEVLFKKINPYERGY